MLGGRESYGGVTESGPGGYITAPEVAWAVRELEKRNLSSTVAQFFLHDDDASASGAVVRQTLRTPPALSYTRGPCCGAVPLTPVTWPAAPPPVPYRGLVASWHVHADERALLTPLVPLSSCPHSDA